MESSVDSRASCSSASRQPDTNPTSRIVLFVSKKTVPMVHGEQLELGGEGRMLSSGSDPGRAAISSLSSHPGRSEGGEVRPSTLSTHGSEDGLMLSSTIPALLPPCPVS